MKKVSVKTYLDTRRRLKNGEYPLKLQVSFNRKTKFFPIQQTAKIKINSFTKEEYDRIMGDKPSRKDRELKRIILSIEQQAFEIALLIIPFNFDKFKELLYGKQEMVYNDIFNDLEGYINTLRSSNKLGTAETYYRTLNGLKKFHKNKQLHYSAISPQFLEQFEKWLLSDKTKISSINTVGIYMRNIRTMCNIAKNSGIISESDYPFGKGKYLIPSVKKETIKALTLDEVKKISQYESPILNRIKARDYWMFSYLCNGMNIADIANLRYSDIIEDKIVFIRQKTKGTTKSRQIKVEFLLHDEAKRIIEKWGNPKKDSYIFPILNEKMDYQTIKKEVAKLNQFITKNIKKIAKELDINPNITAVYARHSFATILMNQGAPIEYISKALGHSSINTTISYLGKFDTNIMKEYSAKLL